MDTFQAIVLTYHLLMRFPISQGVRDGSSNARGVEVGLILARPNNVMGKHALCFSNKILKNKVEYEALLVGMRLTKELSIQHL